MADNTVLDEGTGGDTIATEDIGGVKYQQVKLVSGADDATDRIGGDATNGLDVDVTRSALPSGAATSANQTTVIGHLDGVEGLLTTIDADTGGILTSVQTLDNAISGSEMQVDVVAALPAGTNNIGDVDVASIAAGDNNIGNVDIVTMPNVTNGGTFAVQVDGSALTALQLIDNTIVADDAAFTVGTTSVNVAGYLADQGSTDSVNEGDAGAARMTLDRKQIVTVAPSADTEGLTIFRTLDADETEEEIKATAGKLYGWYLYNDGAAEVYVKFYNATAANVTVGSTTPVLTVPVPAGAAANVEYTNGITFGTAITVAATTGVADADTAAPAANQVIANVFYQ